MPELWQSIMFLCLSIGIHSLRSQLTKIEKELKEQNENFKFKKKHTQWDEQ